MLLGNRDAVTSKNNCFFYTVKFAFHYIFTSHLFETIIFFIYIHTYVDMSPLSQYQKCVNITSVSSSQKEKSRVECSYPSFIPFSDDGPRLKYGSVWQTRARHAKKDKTPTLHNITSQRVTGRECVVRVFFCFFFCVKKTEHHFTHYLQITLFYFQQRHLGWARRTLCSGNP